MESKIQQLSAFQIYSTGKNNRINIMVDQLWIENDRIFFRVVESSTQNNIYFRKEKAKNI